ncbi:ABC transporter ATP-binding protein/permease [Staphylococcus pettenkoferi]|uniref:ABC transporter ATP-binding protein n=1 Tax=Staphylococcus pettenkoferi TaxID=170573 RepID=UPI001F5A3635|nr:ABC transporter ATP-binding protein [Staphylococcus pettenkoferi]MCI2804067.1 ABC transporter ATP-binding protein/permease [Staphylococcus pettenkoferi]MCY1596373.1 ABC transporter ATP-binding protein/permease [Staphylococcus pettenkoferi]MCY1601718.1 ABC transporter ATP-binding protein/permease [Staphylococcus pettenkoferi]MCY1607942.1 ABC transporter ATP-binding protein/permease [Staphylococcus pettenkoferi]MCY1622993.1 ABC transporter ATP-binding protein/permease [Staphylococcus pettenko
MFRITFRILHWMAPYKGRMFAGFMLSFANSILIALPIFLAAQVFARIMSQETISNKDIFNVFLAMIFLVAGRFVMTYAKSRLHESIAYEMTADERLKIGEKLKGVKLGYFDDQTTNNLTTTVTTDLTFLENYTMKMIDIVINGYILISVLILSLLTISVQVALVALSGVILSLISIFLLERMSKRNAPLYHQQQNQLIEKVIEMIRGIKVIKTFAKEDTSLKSFYAAVDNSKRVNTKVELQYTPFNLLHLLSLKVISVFIVVCAVMLYFNGHIDLSTLIMLSIFSFIIFESIEHINSAAHVLEMIAVTLEDLQQIKEAPTLDEGGHEIAVQQHRIEFDHVDFSFSNKKVINDVTLEVQPGTSLAIIGPSGSGKTTLCNLLMRFYDIDKGNIKVGGIDIREMTLPSLMSQISTVFQKVYLFNDTIYNNILFGKPDATKSDIIEAAKQAQCHDFIMSLPQGYQTVINEKGNNLSGGEKQRISIARAILKDAPIIIFDEATASIDPENEHLIQSAIDHLSEGKTMTIAHKINTIKNADQIIVLDEGQIVQRGTHQELIQEHGIYRDFLSIRDQSESWKIESGEA